MGQLPMGGIECAQCLRYTSLELNFYNGSMTMKEILATITQRGQITVPAEVRRLLGTKTGDKLAFQIDGSEVRLTPVAMTLERGYGSVKSVAPPEQFARVEEIAKEEHVARTLAKLRDR
jgi:antitoxin PrlF